MSTNNQHTFGTDETIVLDVETHPIRPDCLDPELVCVGLHGSMPVPWYLLLTKNTAWYRCDASAQAITWPTGLTWLYRYLHTLLTENVILTHRGCYDLGVICALYPELLPACTSLITSGRLYDTRIAEARTLNVNYSWYAGLNAFHPRVQAMTWEGDGPDGRYVKGGWRHQFRAQGRELGLDMISAKYGGPILDKSEWCTRFGELENVLVDQWPSDARDYCIGDLKATGHVQREQMKRFGWRGGMVDHRVWIEHMNHVRDVRRGVAVAMKPRDL